MIGRPQQPFAARCEGRHDRFDRRAERSECGGRSAVSLVLAQVHLAQLSVERMGSGGRWDDGRERPLGKRNVPRLDGLDVPRRGIFPGCGRSLQARSLAGWLDRRRWPRSGLVRDEISSGGSSAQHSFRLGEIGLGEPSRERGRGSRRVWPLVLALAGLPAACACEGGWRQLGRKARWLNWSQARRAGGTVAGPPVAPAELARVWLKRPASTPVAPLFHRHSTRSLPPFLIGWSENGRSSGSSALLRHFGLYAAVLAKTPPPIDCLPK
jgi:hypothetical protein